jgi:hypothetical protein
MLPAANCGKTDFYQAGFARCFVVRRTVKEEKNLLEIEVTSET